MMKLKYLGIGMALLGLSSCLNSGKQSEATESAIKTEVAQTPPMGWNSFDA